MGKSALYLWCAGLAIVTFDLVFTLEIGGFTLKSYYFLFLAAALLFGGNALRSGTFWEKSRELLRAPWVFAFLLFFYELGMAPFSFVPQKSFAYAFWLLFDLAVVAIPGYFLLRADRALATKALALSSCFLVTVLLLDLVAFQYGYIGGLIGFNQEVSLQWGMSRAHAFSFEPSYLAMFFSFTLLYLLGELFSPARKVSLQLLGTAIFLLLVGIFLLGSRTGWLMTGVGLVALLARSYRALPHTRVLASVAGAALLFGIFFYFLPSQHTAMMQKNLLSTIASGTDGSGNTRLQSMKEAVAMGRDTNGLGVGVGASFFYYLQRHPEVIKPQLNISLGGEAVMSIWGQLIAESGIPGVLLYLALGIAMIVLALRNARAGDSRLMSTLVSIFIFFCFTAHLVGNVARTDVWVWFAIWMAVAKSKEAAAAGG